MTSHDLTLEFSSLAELEENPYPTYARWRTEQPVGFFAPYDAWMVSRFDDCELVGSAQGTTDSHDEASLGYLGESLLTLDGVRHRALRAPIDASMRPEAVREHIERVARPIARDYVARVRERGRADATTDLIEPIATRVVGTVLGLADLDDTTLQRWFHQLAAGRPTSAPDPSIVSSAEVAQRESADVVRLALERLRHDPDESVLSHLAAAVAGAGGRLPFEQVAGTTWLMIAGGLQEPAHAAAASLLGLLQHPDQLHAVEESHSLIPAAVREGLRWITPVGAVGRRALVDIEIGGVVVPAGERLLLVVASANRDERRYERPDAFDVFRPRLPVASFGYGAHLCPGHYLARQLEKVVLEEMLDQLPGMRLDPDHGSTVHGFLVRSVTHLPIVWDA